jgi:hypothetical protein
MWKDTPIIFVIVASKMNHLIHASYVVIIIISLNVISSSHHMMTTIVISIMCIHNVSSVNKGILAINDKKQPQYY